MRDSQPLMPGVVKYSALARKVTRRGTTTGMKNESQNDRWLLARIAAPSAGMFSRPSTHGRQTSLSNGPRTMSLRNQ